MWLNQSSNFIFYNIQSDVKIEILFPYNLNIFILIFLQVTSPDGGWITKSNLSLTINPMDRNKDVLCYAVNSALGETVVEKHTVAVLCKY